MNSSELPARCCISSRPCTHWRARAWLPLTDGAVARLVQPVCGDAVVGHLLHVAGADLDFDGHAVHAHQHGVQGLVAVGLGNGDVVLELPGHRLVQAVDAAQYPVAGVHRVDDDAKGEDIHDLREALPLGFHLLVDAVEVLFAADYLDLVALLLQAVHRSGGGSFPPAPCGCRGPFAVRRKCARRASGAGR